MTADMAVMEASKVNSPCTNPGQASSILTSFRSAGGHLVIDANCFFDYATGSASCQL